MRNYNLYDYIQNQKVRIGKLIEQTEKSKVDFKAGKISIHQLHKEGTFERSACRIEFCGCMNIRNGNIKSGLLVKIDGNWDFLGNITYYGDSITEVYKIRFYLVNESLVITKVWTSLDWTFEKINKVFDLEYISLCLENLHGKKRRDFVKLIKYLCNVRYHVQSELIFDNV